MYYYVQYVQTICIKFFVYFEFLEILVTFTDKRVVSAQSSSIQNDGSSNSRFELHDFLSNVAFFKFSMVLIIFESDATCLYSFTDQYTCFLIQVRKY